MNAGVEEVNILKPPEVAHLSLPLFKTFRIFLMKACPGHFFISEKTSLSPVCAREPVLQSGIPTENLLFYNFLVLIRESMPRCFGGKFLCSQCWVLYFFPNSLQLITTNIKKNSQFPLTVTKLNQRNQQSICCVMYTTNWFSVVHESTIGAQHLPSLF